MCIRDRIQAAIDESGYVFPKKRVIISLAPSDKKKSGSHFDLAMAVGVLCQNGDIAVSYTHLDVYKRQPYYRQEKDWKQYGVEITRATMANWVIRNSEAFFLPMYEYFHRKLLERGFAMADEMCIRDSFYISYNATFSVQELPFCGQTDDIILIHNKDSFSKQCYHTLYS